MCFSLHIPIEVQQMIIDEHQDDIVSLRKCSLVCKFWLCRCRLYLFSCIRIEGREDLKSFYMVLEADPSLSSYVKGVRLSPELDAVRRGASGFMEMVPVKLFQQLSHLRSWQLHNPRGHDKTCPISFSPLTIQCIRSVSHRIVELRVTGVIFSTCDELARYIRAFTGLQDLHCKDVMFSNYGSSVAPGNPLQFLNVSVSTFFSAA